MSGPATYSGEGIVTATETVVQPLRRASHRRPARKTRAVPRTLMAVPIAAVLIMQASISFRLLNTVGASGDESLYIYSGHQLIYEMWHGGGSPYYENYFSGAPVIYPVLAAMLDHVGGLVLVRLISGLFMLAATVLLFATARHLFGYWPAVIAAGLFAALGITQGLGAYATFDALALMLMAFAAYCAVKAANTGRWLLAIPIVLLFANATKYASVLFDPVVIMLAALMLHAEGWRRVWHRAATLAGVTSFLLVIAIALAGTAYFHGILFTTVARKTGTGVLNLSPANTSTILTYSWDRIGLIVVFGALAMIIALATPRERSSFPLLALLVIAGLLVTLEAIHLQDLTSVNKHDDFGAWFTAMAAGYTLARGVELIRSPYGRAVWAISALLGVPAALHFYGSHGPIAPTGSMADASQIVAYLQVNSSDHYLMGGKLDEAILYDFHLPIPWWRVTTDSYVKYPIPGRGGNASGSVPGRVCNSLAAGCVYIQGPEAARAAISAHWFAVVCFIGQNHLPIDRLELDTVRATPGYLLISIAGGQTYIYVPDFPNRGLGRLPRPR
jgi:4-amino-4-deoxy-L-arabinose transferase-like glycosyltransferase